jgi:molybdopterin synthase sulfur carrier subunit
MIIEKNFYNHPNLHKKEKRMIRVEFLGPIGKESIEVEADTLKELSDFLKQDEALSSWLPKCAVALNDTMISDLNTSLKAGDKITILPPVCGG